MNNESEIKNKKSIKDKMPKVKTPNVKGSFKESWKMVWKKGNVWGMAIGVLIGGALGAVVNSLANDVIMQAFAKMLPGVDNIENWVVGKESHMENGIEVIDGGIYIGKFLSALLGLLILAFFLVLTTMIVMGVVKSVRKRIDAKKPVVEPAPKVPTTDELILEELRKLNATTSATITKEKVTKIVETKKEVKPKSVKTK